MEKIMTYETLKSFSYVNDAVCKKPVKGIVLQFSGLGNQTRYPVDTVEGEFYGEQGALVYTAYAKRTPVACVANCPVCDVVYHYTERDDLPRTLYSAVYGMEGTLEDGLKAISPLYLVDKMPKVPYYIFHCENDKSVNINSHSEKFVDAMTKTGHDITFTRVADRGHCALTLDAKKQYAQCVLDAVK